MIIRRYVFREVLVVFVAVLAILVLIYTANRFVRFLAEASAGQLSADLLFEMLALKVVENLSVFVPLALYIAVLLGLGRLYKDSEVVAMSAGGIGVRALAQSVLWVSIAFALVVLVLSLVVSPQVAAVQESLLVRAKDAAESSVLSPGVFKEFGEGKQVIYVESVSSDRRRMRNVFVQVRRKGEQFLLVSKSAYQTVRGREGGRFMVLENGYRYSGTPGDAAFVITKFKKHAVRLEHGVHQLVYRKRQMLPTGVLIGSDNPSHIAELQGRISQALSVVFLGMLAVPLARTSPRQGKYAKLSTAIVLYFVYNNAVSIAQKLVERGELHPVIGVWPVHLAVALLAAWLIFPQTSGRWRFAFRLRMLRRKA